MLLEGEADGMGEKTMSSGRTLHVLHRGCVLATVLTLTSVLPACTQLTSKADSAWTITGITQRLAALEILPASNTLANVVQTVLPSGYQATYADGIDINQPVDRPAAELSWNDQVKAVAAASGLAVRMDGKRVYFEKEAADITSAAVPPKLVDATIMGMPRDGRHRHDAPAPLMTPQEAALLEKAQAAAAASTVAPAPAPAVPTATPPATSPVQSSADIPVQQPAPATQAAVLAPETVPLVIITEEADPTVPVSASPTPPAVEAVTPDKPITLTPASVEPPQAPVVQEAGKSAAASPFPAAEKLVASLTANAESAPVEPQKAPVSQETEKTTPVNPRLANITVMGTPEGVRPRADSVVQPAAPEPAPIISPASQASVDVPAMTAAPEPAPVASTSSPTPPVAETVVLAQTHDEPAKAAEAEKPTAEISPEPEKTVPAAGDVAEQSLAEAPVAMVPATPEEQALVNTAPTAPDLSAAVGSNFDASKGRPVAAVGAWSAERGQTLREVLQGWCERASVELNWSTNYDFPLKASVSIDDTFENAVRTLLTGFSGASPQPVGRLHRQANAGSRLLVIETRGNRYED